MDPIQNQSASQPVMAVSNLDKKARTSLILGIIGMVAWLLPIAGLPVTIVGLVKGVKALHAPAKKSLAVAGVTLCIIGLVLTIINASIGAYMGATGQHPIVNDMLNQ